MKLSPRCCPMCASSDHSRVVAEANIDPEKLDAYAFASRKLPENMHHRLVLCQKCDLLYASPIPDESALGEAYRDAAYDSQEEARYAARTYAKALRPYLGSLPDRQSAMDVGAGDGAFVSELQRMPFASVVGIEPSAAPIQAAATEVKTMLRQEMFGKCSAAAGSLTLLTCFQTLEHVADPAEFARTAFSLLKPGGALCLVTHDRNSLVNRLMGRKSPIYDIEHMQLFTPKSVSALLSGCGFVNVSGVALANVYPLVYWLRLAPMPRRLKEALTLALKRCKLGYVPVGLRVGNVLTIAYRPAACADARNESCNPLDAGQRPGR